MASTRLEISEKTLELNVCAELLPYIRSIPGCSNAMWVGMKQDQEARNGIDELITNVPRGRHIILQFKAPRARPRGGPRYVFSLNDKQHRNLVRSAVGRPAGVHYVLPHINTMSTLRSSAPTLLSDTWALPVASLASLGPGSSGRHRVECLPPRCDVYSELHETSLLPIADALAECIDSGRSHGDDRTPIATRDGPLSGDEVLELLSGIEESTAGNRQAIGQMLRGLSDIVLPDGL